MQTRFRTPAMQTRFTTVFSLFYILVLFALLFLFAALTLSAHAGEKRDADIPSYVDPISGAIFPIPEGMTLVDSGTKGKTSYARFSFPGEDSIFIYLTCEDKWEEISGQFAYYSARGQTADTVYPVVDVSMDYGVGLSQVRNHIWANAEYYCINLPANARSPYSDLSGPATVYLRYKNGYRLEFFLSDGEESKYLPLMEELAKNGTFISPSKLTGGFSLATSIFALAVSFLSCQMFRLSIKQAGENTGKARSRAFFHGFLSISLFLPAELSLFELHNDDGLILYLICFVVLLNFALSYRRKDKKLPNRIFLLPSLRLSAHHRMFLLINALLFLRRDFSPTQLFLFGAEVLLLALSCSLPHFVFHNSLRENFNVDPRAAFRRAHLRGALVFGLIAFTSFLLSLLLPVSLVFLLFSLGFLLLPLSDLVGAGSATSEGGTSQTPAHS